MAIPQSQLATLSREQLEAMVMASHKARKVTLKVTEKGGVSMYGLGRFPVTLYRGQWERLIAAADDVTSFIAANASLLSVKE